MGNPIRKLYDYEEYINKIEKEMSVFPSFDETYKIGMISKEKKKEMIRMINEIGFIK